MAQQPPVDHSLLIVEASQSHSDTPHSIETLWRSDQPQRRDRYLTTDNTRKRQTSFPPARFEPKIPVSKRQQKAWYSNAKKSYIAFTGACNSH